MLFFSRSKSTSFNIKNMLLAFHQRVSSIQSCFNDDDDAKASKENQILINLKNNLVSTSDSPTTSKISTLYPFITVSFLLFFLSFCIDSNSL